MKKFRAIVFNAKSGDVIARHTIEGFEASSGRAVHWCKLIIAAQVAAGVKDRLRYVIWNESLGKMYASS
jgi:hypothetical protein